MPVRVRLRGGDLAEAIARRTSSHEASCVSRVVSLMLSDV